MKSRLIQFSVERARISFLAIVGLAVITGCSSGMSRVQTWEGTVENADQVAVLSSPGAINVREVNGQLMTSFLIDDLSIDYELLPGENRIVFVYKTIWSKSEAVENGESKVHVVETPRQTVTINAEPGETYQFQIEKPDNRRQAEALVRDFSVAVVSSGGQTVATSSLWTASGVASDSQKAVTRAPVPDSRPATAPVDATAATTLEQLKLLWGDASEEEKREFLRWAFE
jgi:uncharacterized protein YccT (UPF0319 family)